MEIVAGLLRHPSPISIDASDRVRLSLTYSSPAEARWLLPLRRRATTCVRKDSVLLDLADVSVRVVTLSANRRRAHTSRHARIGFRVLCTIGMDPFLPTPFLVGPLCERDGMKR